MPLQIAPFPYFGITCSSGRCDFTPHLYSIPRALEGQHGFVTKSFVSRSLQSQHETNNEISLALLVGFGIRRTHFENNRPPYLLIVPVLALQPTYSLHTAYSTPPVLLYHVEDHFRLADLHKPFAFWMFLQVKATLRWGFNRYVSEV